MPYDEPREASFLGDPIAKDATYPPQDKRTLVFSKNQRWRVVRYGRQTPGWDPKRHFDLWRELRQVAYERARLINAQPDRSTVRIATEKTRRAVLVRWIGLSVAESVNLVVAMDRVFAQVMTTPRPPTKPCCGPGWNLAICPHQLPDLREQEGEGEYSQRRLGGWIPGIRKHPSAPSSERDSEDAAP